MKLNRGEFVTEEDDGCFYIRITCESDCSSDGGYTFEDVTNPFSLNTSEAEALVEELQCYIKNQQC
jgi:hypothetical protein